MAILARRARSSAVGGPRRPVLCIAIAASLARCSAVGALCPNYAYVTCIRCIIGCRGHVVLLQYYTAARMHYGYIYFLINSQFKDEMWLRRTEHIL